MNVLPVIPAIVTFVIPAIGIFVIPAKAGIQGFQSRDPHWIN
jgi:hypothetical protein